MRWRILTADLLSIAAGILSVILFLITPAIGILAVIATATSIGTAAYALLWAGIRLAAHYTITPKLGVGFQKMEGDLALVISNASPFPVLLDATQLHYTPSMLSIDYPEGDVEEYDALSMEAETFDPRLSYLQERREEVFRWNASVMSAKTGMTTIGLDLSPPPDGGKPIIPLLYVRLYSDIRPADIPWLPSIGLLNRLYEPIPLQPVTYRFEQEMPDLWDRMPPEPLEGPEYDWPDIYHRDDEDSDDDDENDNGDS
ncbi:hypothetical protein JCM30237_24380 [Halolamina litorea]|uniref:Uncharacterized protein n=1 Tax=Halolamina litorea TaxID=1515593 RepID=A0ABD6BTN4_9EURY|nr:hypothetical protein [Halolamina litorea]